MDEELSTRLQEADRLYAEVAMDSALAAYEAIVATDPSVAWAHSRIGAILAQRGDLDGAEAALLRAVELDPTLPQAHSNLGNIYYARGSYQEALEKYKQAVALSPDEPIFHENLHAAYKKLGKLGEAVGALKQAHRLDRAKAKAETKERIAGVKARASGGKGCLGSVLITLALVTLLMASLV